MIIDPSKEFKLTDKKEIKENKRMRNGSHPFILINILQMF